MMVTKMFGVRIVVMITMLMDFASGQCFGCIDITGTTSLSPLSYNTVRSNVFNGTQPSNEGCTNRVSINGQVTIDCGQGTTLIDCNRGFNGRDNSDLSSTFAWNRSSSVAEQVSIVFRFNQQINISRITMFVFNSQSNNIIIPNVGLYWSNDDSIIPSNEINITPGSVRRDREERRRWFINVNDNGLQFQYLRIEMSFYDDSEWIFLNEVEFCGNTAPYNITQPPTDNYVQVVSPTEIMATLTCSLNVTIPSSMTLTWLHNGTIIMTPPNEVLTAGNTTTLVIRNLQPSDAGVYQCVFNDSVGSYYNSGWVLRRNIVSLIAVPQVVYPPSNLYPITFTDSSSLVRLMCSLNINIPSSVTIFWTYNSVLFIVVPPNEVITTANTTTLVIRDPQPSDAGIYQCTFAGLYVRGSIMLEFNNITLFTTKPSLLSIPTTKPSLLSIPTNKFAQITTTEIDQSTTTIEATSASTFTTQTVSPSVLNATSQSDYNMNNNGSSVTNSSDSSAGVIVAIVVLVIVIFIIITVIVAGIIIVWKRKKTLEHTKQEDVYYSTVNEKSLPRSPTSKPEAVYSEMNDGQDNKEPQYMDITDKAHPTKQADKVTLQDNPAYSVASEHQVELQDNPAYCTSPKTHVQLQDNPAYSISSINDSA